jgi:hypothetical protein
MRLHLFKPRLVRSGKAPEPVTAPESAPIPEALDSVLRSPEVRQRVAQDGRGLVAALLMLQRHLECIRAGEWQRAQQRMQALSAPQQVAVEAITREIVNAVLQAPLSALAFAKDDERQTMVECLTSIFKLGHVPARDNPSAVEETADDQPRRARAV